VPRRHPFLRFGLVVVGLAIAGAGFAGCSSPTQSSPLDSLTGTWNGSASDSSGPGQITWQIAQTASSFSGTMTIFDTNSGYGGGGSVSGTVAGASVHFSMRVAPGGFEAPYASCTSDVSGDALITTPSMTGTYSGSSSCGGAITAGQLTLTKQ
jgi:hypothetical protein